MGFIQLMDVNGVYICTYIVNGLQMLIYKPINIHELYIYKYHKHSQSNLAGRWGFRAMGIIGDIQFKASPNEASGSYTRIVLYNYLQSIRFINWFLNILHSHAQPISYVQIIPRHPRCSPPLFNTPAARSPMAETQPPGCRVAPRARRLGDDPVNQCGAPKKAIGNHRTMWVLHGIYS